MGIDNIRHPIKDTVKADNSTYSSNKIESLIHSATELPETSIEDAGDVLMVNDEGEWAKGEIVIPQELPTVTSEDAGDVLMVSEEGEWTNGEIPAELPSVTSADEGKVLTVNSEGVWDAENLPTPSSDVFLITLTDDSGTYTSDKTASEIHAAAFGNKIIKLNIPVGASQRAVINVDFIQFIANIAYTMRGGYLDPTATPMPYRYFTLQGTASAVQIVYAEANT